MNRQEHLAVAVMLVVAALWAPPAAAQSRDRPSDGKIDRVERESRGGRSDDRGATSDDDDDEDDESSGVHARDPFRWITRRPGQGYLPYPYADRRALERFVLRHVMHDRGYNVMTAFYYRDIGSTVRGGHFTWDGALGPVTANVEYTAYREPTLTDTDYMHLLRFGVGGVIPAGNVGIVRLGVGLRGIILDDGSGGGGPDFEAATELFPRRPWVVSARGRIGAVRWDWGTTSLVRDASLGVGYLIGRVEVTAAHRWTQIGHTPKFAGPMLGLRFWF